MNKKVLFSEIDGFQVKTEMFGEHENGISKKVNLVTTIRNNYVEVVYEVWNNQDVKYCINVHDAIERYNNLK